MDTARSGRSHLEPTPDFGDMSLRGKQNEESLNVLVEESLLYCSTAKGEVRIYDIKDFLQSNNLKIQPHANKKINYNAERKADEDFLRSVRDYGLDSYTIQRSFGYLYDLNTCLLKKF